ncbi:TetR/AcrR family transcriptional regulator [Bacillus sp. Marseille-Q3570]|uniref:TetR/AcrR family transcriptional regulator n=1 Tax=Bacillus sp. Marseille-Q3570 TaxID=2963522 RepID=UPI0021B7FDE6|nr:TetR/AcrR family transcriptional regulator [Bacillus sp. Marseille-Q3570]
MNPAFERLPEKKKQQIINACMEEFAENGFENTSTNKIIERAEISKGLLFHYFKNKKTLYLFLLERSARLVSDQVFDHLDDETETDFFERIKTVAILKMNFFSKHPNEYLILINGFFNTPKELEKDITDLYEKLYKQIMQFNSNQLFDYLHEDQIRTGLTKEFVIEFVMNVMDQLNRGLLQQYKGKEADLLEDFNPLLNRLEQYIDILKYGVYERT